VLGFTLTLDQVRVATSMVYVGVEVTACNGICDDGVKAGVVTGVPHWLNPPNGLWCVVDVV
jgi:hypothetical protein